MDEDKVRKAVLDCLSEYSCGADLQNESTTLGELGLDSLDMTEFVMDVESELNIHDTSFSGKLSDLSLDKITIKDAIDAAKAAKKK